MYVLTRKHFFRFSENSVRTMFVIILKQIHDLIAIKMKVSFHCLNTSHNLTSKADIRLRIQQEQHT